jgi:thiamine biosynthesis lipoprotein
MTSQSTSPVRKRGSKDKPWLTFSLAAILISISNISMPSYAEWFGENRPLMGTDVSVYLWHDDADAGRAAVEAVFDEVVRIDAMMSTYKDDSVISEINREAATRPVAAGEELYNLILRSLDISILTLGAFDITYDSVGQHYDFRERQRPDDSTIERELGRVDYRFVLTEPDTTSIRFAEEGVRINLGGIAKGYVVEQCAEILRKRGVRNAIVTAGGDTRLVGDRRGEPWVVGVRDPRKDDEVAVRNGVGWGMTIITQLC